MSHKDVYWGGRGHCPKCGRFCSGITGHFRGPPGWEVLEMVTGWCKHHGLVDLSHQPWDYNDHLEREDNHG